MAVDEAARLQLFESLERAIGSEAAVTLMEHLPPGCFTTLATKDDLLRMEERLDARFDSMESRMKTRIALSEQRLRADFRAELVAAVTSQTRTVAFTMAGTVVSFGGLMLAAIRLG